VLPVWVDLFSMEEECVALLVGLLDGCLYFEDLGLGLEAMR
jgi:hypothetical protein